MTPARTFQNRRRSPTSRLAAQVHVPAMPICLGLALCVGSWSAFWLQALLGTFVLPEILLAALFFAGTGLAAFVGHHAHHASSED